MPRGCSPGWGWRPPPIVASAPTRADAPSLDLASALVHEPRILFLDEPTTGLDPVSRQTIWEEVEELNREGTTVFLTTQYLEEADRLADRVGIIDLGRIVAEGTPGQLKSEVGRPHLEIRLTAQELADGGLERAERAIARWGRRLPSKDGALLVEVERGAAEIAPIIRSSTRPGSRLSRSTSCSPSSTMSSSQRRDIRSSQARERSRRANGRLRERGGRALSAREPAMTTLTANLRVIAALGGGRSSRPSAAHS